MNNNGYGLVDKAGGNQQELQIDNKLDDNIVFQDEELKEEQGNLLDGQEVEDEVDDKQQWTQEQDEILIENYQQFSSTAWAS